MTTHWRIDRPEPPATRVGYVLKRYPRFSETFVVNEILAHEAADLPIEIFSLRPTVDTHFQHAIADVRAGVTHIRYGGIRAEALWQEMQRLGGQFPRLWAALAECDGYDASEVYQGLLLAQQVVAKGVTHLHAHFATSATAVARLASLVTGVPYSFTAHAKDIFHENNDEALLARKFAAARQVVTVSEFNLRDLRRRFPAAGKRIRRIYNGIHLQNYSFNPPQSRPAKLVAVGRLVEKKGFDDLVRACRVLVDAGASIQCEIIGGGDCEDALQSLIAELHLRDTVRLRGPLPHREAHQSIAEAAVCVAPCVTAASGDRDGLPTVLLEAMALGTPCVATDVTGVTEAVRDGETGLVVPERKPELLADAIRRLLADRTLGAQLAHAARRLIEEQFDVTANAAELRRVFAAETARSVPAPHVAPALAEAV
ncbi:MAG: colanic acid biosynthesis glycosyltransferase WcaL [Planctomycetaceae bacterium]|nr:colanic acid biosynthesis glycosyltransferase WcaL [Planctomycetaceae bacterium]